MSKQKDTYPYGIVLWLHFTLMLSLIDRTGNIVTTIEELANLSDIPKKLIKPTLGKLARYRLIKLKQLNAKYFLITLKHHRSS